MGQGRRNMEFGRVHVCAVLLISLVLYWCCGDVFHSLLPQLLILLQHFAFKVAFVGVCGTIAALAARGYRYVSENKQNSLIDAQSALIRGPISSAASTSSKKITTSTTTQERASKSTTI